MHVREQPNLLLYTPSYLGRPNPASAATPRTSSCGLGLGAGSPGNSYLLPHTPRWPFPTAATMGTLYGPSHTVTRGLRLRLSLRTGQGDVFARQRTCGLPLAGPPQPRGGSGLMRSSNGTANRSVGSAKDD
ncbi:hypothetical protein BD311DRAFT_376711 [Dichomitus squalens]|uniref:Uncharacterized protein n=1 Tax=Dichomitus squalens TaxID=114155 RepID=A0A4Q9MJD0_9APHY|nr:hypothetical protein BD311DRAFT_376711 [Dichomitus squalens]